MKSLLKITTDIFMSLSFIFLMFYNFTGEKTHKFLGIFFYSLLFFIYFLTDFGIKIFLKENIILKENLKRQLYLSS